MAEQDEKARNADTPSFQVIDKRHFLDPGSIDKDAVAEEKPRYPSFVEELMARMEETERRFQEKKQQIDEEIARTRARLEGDFDRKLELEKQKIVLPFLEVLDNLRRAMDAAYGTGTAGHLLEGLRMTADLFRSKLQSMGVEPIDALHRPFDPNLEQAIGTVPVRDGEDDGIVVEEVRAGYCMNGQLLRPAQVRVGRLE